MKHQPIAEFKDNNDAKIAEWGRSRHLGYQKFKHSFLQPAPLLFTQDHHALPLADIYRGRSVFLICGGPSFNKLDQSKLKQPGVITMGINNSPRTFRPNLHCSVDSPDHWIRSIWLDPTIQKFCPISHADKFVFNSDKWEFMKIRVGDCPNVIYYKRNERFIAKQYLWEDTINWGCHKDYGGSRSIMLAAIRILFILGFRRVYLLGCDFDIGRRGYHFEQYRNKGARKGNRNTYEQLQKWFTELRPLFEAEDYFIYNCNENSKLEAFDKVHFQQGLDDMASHMDFVDTSKERTAGLYDTKTEDKRKGVGKVLDPNPEPIKPKAIVAPAVDNLQPVTI